MCVCVGGGGTAFYRHGPRDKIQRALPYLAVMLWLPNHTARTLKHEKCVDNWLYVRLIRRVLSKRTIKRLGRPMSLFVVYLTTLFQWLKITQQGWKGDKWMMNWKESGLILRYYPSSFLEGLRKTTKTSVTIAGLWDKIWTRDLPNTEWKPLDHDVRCYKGLLVRKLLVSFQLSLVFELSKWNFTDDFKTYFISRRRHAARRNVLVCSELSSGMYCRVKWGRQSSYTAVHPRRQFWTSYSPPCELEISQTVYCSDLNTLRTVKHGSHFLL
jgi:hypothetical protein